MLIKPIKYGQQLEHAKAQVVGSVAIEILPQGGLKHHLQIEIEEANNLGKWPEPMLRVSCDHQKPVFLPLHTVLVAAGMIAPPDIKQSILGANIIEPEQVTVTPAKAIIGRTYSVLFRTGVKKTLQLKGRPFYEGVKVLDFGSEYHPYGIIKHLVEVPNE